MNLTDIRAKIYLLTSTSGTSDFPDATLVPLVNNAYERVTGLINSADGRWQFDDSNNTDMPIATTDIVQNQQDYTFSAGQLEVTRMEIKDSSGNWQKLDPLDQTDIYNQSLTDFMKTPGVPQFYDKIGNSIFLYPVPNYSQSASLKLWYERGPNYFLTSDTTKQPGFNTLFHDLLAYWPAYDYALAHAKSNANSIMAVIQEKEDALEEYYALRSHDDPVALKARPRSYR